MNKLVVRLGEILDLLRSARSGIAVACACRVGAPIHQILTSQPHIALHKLREAEIRKPVFDRTTEEMKPCRHVLVQPDCTEEIRIEVHIRVCTVAVARELAKLPVEHVLFLDESGVERHVVLSSRERKRLGAVAEFLESDGGFQRDARFSSERIRDQIHRSPDCRRTIERAACPSLHLDVVGTRKKVWKI